MIREADTPEWRHGAAAPDHDAQLRLLLGTQAFWGTDANGVVVTDSPSWRAYTGQTVEEWLGFGWLDAIHPDDRAYAERQGRDAVANCRPVDAEFRLRAPDGGWRWTNVRAVPVLDAQNSIGKWAGLNVDIDARKRAEEALRRREERQTFLLELTDAFRPLAGTTDIQMTAARMLVEQLGVNCACYVEVEGRGDGRVAVIRVSMMRAACRSNDPISPRLPKSASRRCSVFR